MSGEPSQGAGTALDPATEIQRQAAYAYARELLPPPVSDEAAEDALAAFRHSIEAAGDNAPEGQARDELLLAVTRLMTAVSMPDRSSPLDRRRAVWASIGAQSHCSCRETGVLMAARANGNIEPREAVALDQHVAECAECRALGVDVARAEQSFRDTLAPASRGGGLLRGGRGMVLLSAGVVAVLAAGTVALTTSGSTPPTRAAVISTISTPTTTHAAATASTAHKHTASSHKSATHKADTHKAATHKAATHKASHHSATKPSTTKTTTASSGTAAADTAASATPASTPVVAATPPASETTPPASTSSAASTSSSSGSAPTESGTPSSLPSVTAPQQGIGGATTTP
jgi:hypothetical protein